VQGRAKLQISNLNKNRKDHNESTSNKPTEAEQASSEVQTPDPHNSSNSPTKTAATSASSKKSDGETKKTPHGSESPQAPKPKKNTAHNTIVPSKTPSNLDDDTSNLTLQLIGGFTRHLHLNPNIRYDQSMKA
jgi:hypothetical protein